MPNAGAVIPPIITALREHTAGIPHNKINTATYIELDTGNKQ